MEKIVFIDGNSLLNRAYFALPALNDSQGRNVNAVYGFVNLLMKVLKDYAPTKLVVAFDKHGHNFRKDLYADYKANRKGMPDDLAKQMPVLHDLLEKMKVVVVEQAGIEADDIIGTLAKRFSEPCFVVTGDRDMLQLVDDKVVVLLTKKGLTEVESVTSQNIVDLYGLFAEQIVEYKALRGDTSDNIPGVQGIGEKTATALLTQYKTLNGVYENIDKIKGAQKEKLLKDKEMAYVSKQLATIKLDVDIDCNLQDCTLPVFGDEAQQFLADLGFKSILTRLQSNVSVVTNLPKAPEVEEKKVNLQQYKQLVSNLLEKEKVAVYFAKNLYLACDDKTEYVVEICDDMFAEITQTVAYEVLKPLLESDVAKIVYDSKAERHFLDNLGIELNNVRYDVSLLSYLTLEKHHKTFQNLKESFNLQSNATALFWLSQYGETLLKKMEVESLYWDVELPLATLLYEMEKTGVKVDVDYLEVLSKTFAEQLGDLAQEIYTLAQEKFNVASPKQLGVVLFEKLNLPHGKKTKTGYSTDNDVLQKIAPFHPVVEKIIEYRALSKLRSTYVEAMKPLIKFGKVHTTYNQSLTTTGRLSSSDPNLQNIPIRTELGKEIRKLFLSQNGRFVGADYSQIELRLVSAFSGDENLLHAFKTGQDVHARVASELVGIPLELVTKDMRRMAKSVNFGIIYGISDYGLSQNANLGFKEAKKYINDYFEKFPLVKSYLDQNVNFARENGYVKTITNRRRYIPEIKSANGNLRGFGERAAKNMPLQGSAADVMKIAMLKVDQKMKEQGLKSQIVLQIHDELIIDCFEEEVEVVKNLLKTEMEQAVQLDCPLSVDLEEGLTLYEV
ncbi:MAG: DNA polymerase I [Clostridia bacterium]|nr:DNA polymerase I [Clostridia bacterium]